MRFLLDQLSVLVFYVFPPGVTAIANQGVCDGTGQGVTVCCNLGRSWGWRRRKPAPSSAITGIAPNLLAFSGVESAGFSVYREVRAHHPLSAISGALPVAPANANHPLQRHRPMMRQGHI